MKTRHVHERTVLGLASPLCAAALGFSTILGAVGAASAADPSQLIDFAINNGRILPYDDFAAKVTVLGCAITVGGEYDGMVTMQVTVEQGSHADVWEPFGPVGLPVTSNLNDYRQHHRTLDRMYENTSDKISVSGSFWMMHDSDDDPLDNASWYLRRTQDSFADGEFVKVLRDGDPVPNIPGFMNQDNVQYFVRNYIDQRDNTVILNDNQAIFLFELGTTDLGSPAADFQDLVVLITLGHSPAEAALMDVPVVIAD